MQGKVASDKALAGEVALPASLVAAKRKMLPPETERYKILGREAAEAMTDTLAQVTPDWTEFELAAFGAKSLWSRGIHPALTLAAGSERMGEYRHPTPTEKKIGDGCMLVFCARKYGLYANLTRFVSFKAPSASTLQLHETVAKVEAVALAESRPGASLNTVFRHLQREYEKLGYPGEYYKHHQGGTTGYLSREIVATPYTTETIEVSTPLAWNPSLPGAKIEDTFLVTPSGLSNVTLDPRWPAHEMEGRIRPKILVRA
jgi:Xaa-Pro aminopeptidase